MGLASLVSKLRSRPFRLEAVDGPEEEDEG
jgi:hypothetical protein